MQLFTTRDRRLVTLGAEIARGGEGAIFSIDQEPGWLAKKYLSQPTAAKLNKLKAMSDLASPDLIKVAAWPTELLVARADDPPSKAVGFLMPRAKAPDQLHELYTPKSRSRTFPDADLRFIIHVAANVVRAFGVVHEAGHVIGDVNHGHLLVSADGRVTLIDCDSFQVNIDNTLFTCDVGVPLFTAPELQGQSYRGLVRTANHDRFGLAVLLFHLLFMGRHPYAGAPTDARQSAEIDDAIKAGRFAYGQARHALGVDRPPGTIPLETYGAGIAQLFESAFSHPPNPDRPDERSWLSNLNALKGDLKPCSQSPAHQYPGHLTACPWCAMEGRTGARLFGAKLRMPAGGQGLGIEALWRAIDQIPSPTNAAKIDVSGLQAPARTKGQRDRILIRSARRLASSAVSIVIISLGVSHQLSAGIFTLLVVGAFLLWPRTGAKRLGQLQATRQTAKREYERLIAEWKSKATSEPFKTAKARFEQARIGISNEPAERARRIAELTSEDRQREQYLDQFRIDRGKISGVGPSRAAVLRSFGIETAWDVSAASVRAVPGFGPTLVENLMSWRANHLGHFRYDPRRAPSPSDIRAIDVDLVARRQANERMLAGAPAELKRTVREIEQARIRLRPLIEQRYVAFLAAQRDLVDG